MKYDTVNPLNLTMEKANDFLISFFNKDFLTIWEKPVEKIRPAGKDQENEKEEEESQKKERKGSD